MIAAAGPLPSDIQPVANETRDRIITGLVTLIPFVAIGLAGWQVWGEALHWSDVFLFLGMYLLHRARDHGRLPPPPHPPQPSRRSRWLHGLLAILGSAAIEGPVISWVADHRKHHAFSDEEGDPHSPHVDHGHGWSGAMRGLFHAHMGWLFIHTQRGNKERFAPDLLKDPIDQLGRPHLHLLGDRRPAAPLRARLGDRRHPLRRPSPACSGAAWSASSSSTTSPTASTRSATSSASRDFETTDESRNLALIAIPTLGEAWHNNHHAFPTSATHGLGRWQIDISALVIDGLEKAGPGLGRRPRLARADGRQGRLTRPLGRLRAIRTSRSSRRRPG